jgi:hypothetical protein
MRFLDFSNHEKGAPGKKFRSDQEVETACSTILLKLAANGL